MLEQADEVQEALGRQYGMPEIDDDELAAELDALGNYFIYISGSKACVQPFFTSLRICFFLEP